MIKNPSPYQQDIFNAIITKQDHIAIQATAGAGKTSTIIEASKMIKYGKRSIFVAFNKSIVKELKEKLPQTVQCSTMHSVGMKCINTHFPMARVEVKPDKQLKFIIPFYEDKSPREKWAKIYQVDNIMQKARATMTNCDFTSMEQLCERYAIDADDDEIRIAYKALQKYYDANQSDQGGRYNLVIDFQDMIEMVVRDNQISMPQFDYVFVDEVQDLSKLDHKFIDRLVKKPLGRKIVVGDPKQSIYGFRGSDPKSFENFVNQPNTIKLPLSISYRCSKAVVKEAQKVYQDIEPFENNPEGEVRNGKVSEIQEGDMVVCRNTRPLIVVYLQLIRQQKKAKIIGKETEKGLLALLSRWESHMLTSEAKQKLPELTNKMGEELRAKGVNNVTSHPKYLLLQEKLEILRIVFDIKNTIGEVERFIEEIFDEEREGIKLMTIHKSKGLECDIVFWIEKFCGVNLIPSQYAVTEDMKIQENNLKFVAITRAKNTLVKLDVKEEI